MLLRSFEPPNLTFPASMLSIRIASVPFTCCFEASNHPIIYSQSVCYLYALPVCDLHAASKLRITQSSIFPASMLSIRIASMPFTCCFEASNHPILHSRPVCYLYVLPVCDLHAASNYPILHSRPVCYLYVLPVCYLHAASKLRTSQSYIPGQYAIYTYCQYAIYMLLRSFELPNLTFPASMLSIRIASVPFTCCFEASNLPILHSRLVFYLYVLPVCDLHAASKLRTTQSYIPGQYAIYTYCQCAIYMLLRSFEPPSRPVCYLYVLPVCHLHAASKLRTTQSSIPGQYAIYTYSSMPFTCCFEASNTQSYIPGQYAIYTYCQCAIYMLLRSFEPPNLTFPASMLSIRIASMPFTCCFEASNHPIFHSRPVCYLYVINRLMRYILKGQRYPIPSSLMRNWGWSQKP